MSDFLKLKNTLAQCANIPTFLLDNVRYQGDSDVFLEQGLYEILGWDFKNHCPFYPDGQFLQRIDWQSPTVIFEHFFSIKNNNIHIDTSDFPSHDASNMSDNAFYNDNSEYSLDEMIAGYEKHRAFYLNYFNEKLAPHQLRFIEIGANAHSYLLLVNDDLAQLKTLSQLFAKIDIFVLTE